MSGTMITCLDDLLEHARRLPRQRVVVAGAENRAALEAAVEAESRLPLESVFVGDPDQLQATARALGLPGIPEARLIPACTSEEAARRAVAVARQHGGILLKGSPDTSTFLKAVLDPQEGVRTGRVLSDVLLFEDPVHHPYRMRMITDGGVIPNPDLSQKIEIIRNAVSVAHALGWERPRVAVLSATEKIHPVLPSTLEAAILAKMNERGQIPGCVIEGPLSLDLAISPESAAIKGVTSAVAGHADILVCPNIEVANILAKGIIYFAGRRVAHVAVGAAVPVLIPSRSDRAEAKLLSIALGMLMSAFEAAGVTPNGPSRE
ncbi:MAG: phosphate acyltransferase [Blastocatellia bacterium]|nr:phosphate acyltransferase [Blastocatellia bacterium]MCS7156259.1 phosphate acyltransferase [Blastocatellia bacterium]MCX7751391.1 phosphate acyltransferase [Blastocatellia bacterium]MDW8169104.1 phosphate acyltransferase [Acidobacteriota bacterium]MDW8255808.1 phosphate acyltransferase [Acidobacteriota bacterium]